MSPYKPGDKIRRKDGREFPDGQLVAEVVERPGRFGSDRWPRVWIKDGQWVDTSDVEAYVEPPEPVEVPELIPQAKREAEPDYKRWYERELKWRRKEEKRNAKVNAENAALRKRVRELDWEARRHKIMYEQSRMKEYQILAQRMALIKDIATTPIDDWISMADEPRTVGK